MARRTTKKDQLSRTDKLGARLELIRNRHRKLILEPREMIAADLDEGRDDTFEEMGMDQLQLADAIGLDRF